MNTCCVVISDEYTLHFCVLNNEDRATIVQKKAEIYRFPEKLPNVVCIGCLLKSLIVLAGSNLPIQAKKHYKSFKD
jgi:hypothetical protein